MKMELSNKEALIKDIPLFSQLPDRELKLIAEHSQLEEFRKGAVIYAQGSPPSAFYCIIVGRAVVLTTDHSGAKKFLEYIHRGKYFGIISLLTNEPHSVTAEALNDCLLLVIKKDDFDFLIRRIPAIAVDLSRTLSRRLKRKDVHSKTVFESTILSVFSSYSQAGKTVYALNLALSLSKETGKGVLILDILPKDKTHSLPRRLGFSSPKVFDLTKEAQPAGIKDFVQENDFKAGLACIAYDPEDENSSRKLLGILSFLVNDYNYLILDLPSVMDGVIFSVLNQSDFIHILSSPDEVDLKKTRHLIQRLHDEFGFSSEKARIIINEYKFAKIPYLEQAGLLGQEIFATLPKIDFNAADRIVLDCPDCEYAKAVRRIARTVGDRIVGLVLGVGVAYGFCHIGVLKVIEEENIPIDIIAGSSIGALIASLWAIGKSSGEIIEITKEFSEPKHIWNLIDITFPRLGFIKGNKLQGFIKRHFGNKTFYDTRLPLKIIASDVKRKEPRILDKGPLADAIMASCSMPGVFAPFRFRDEALFDGGVTHPLPTEPLVRLGVNKIIAVNVTPSREDIMRQYDKVRQDLNVKPALEIKPKGPWGLQAYIKNMFKSNILDIIFSSVEILQSEVARNEGQLADVVLHPDTSGLFWLELHRAEEFAKRGEDEARANIDKIKKMINE